MAQNKDTTSTLAMGWALMLLVLFVFGAVIWYYNKYTIMDTARWIRYVELQAAMLVVDNDQVVATGGTGEPLTLRQFASVARTLPPTTLTPEYISLLSQVTMRFYLIIFSFIMVIMALWAMFYGPGTSYRRRFEGLDQLIKAQSKSFPYITPLVDFNPLEQPFRAPGAPVPADLPLFAEALSPEEWIAYHQIPTYTNREIDQRAAIHAFSKQLGRPWRGWMALAPHRQLLLAAFCLRAARKRSESDDMLGEIACCWNKGTLKIPGSLIRKARGILRNRNLSEKVLQKCNMHAFETTVMIRALLTAREEGGVLAPATFVWLRGYDRALWYPLNNLGRNAYHMEALGAMCHFKAEKLLQRPVVRPKVEGAASSLADYMKSFKARPVPQIDYSKSKKRGIQQVTGGA